MIMRSRPIIAAALLATALLFLAGGARADDTPLATTTTLNGFTLQAIGSETGSWESNPLLLTTPAKPLYGSITTPEMIVTDKTPTALLNVDASAVENVFNQSSFDSTDFHDKANFTDQNQRWGFGLQEQTDYDTTRTSELFQTGLNGVVLDKAIRHFGISATPQVSFNSTSVDKWSLAGTAAESTYQNPVFANYEIFNVTPSYARNLDPLNTATLSLQAQQYKTTSGPETKDDTIGPQIGWNGILTPRLTANAAVGVQEARQFGSGVASSSWTLQYDFSGEIKFKGQEDQAGFVASRMDYPFANGAESLLTTLSLTETHDLNRNFSLNVGGSYQTATYQVTTPGDLEDLITGTGGITYHATERLDVAGNYQYRYETLTNTSGNAQDHVVTLGLVYHPKPWTF